MPKKLPISKNQLKVLKFFSGEHGDDYAYYCRAIALTIRMSQRLTRVCLRALSRLGYVELQRGLFDTEGMLAGSGWAITEKGCELLEEINKN